MSYFIIPKINNIINLNPKKSDNINTNPYISYSLFNYYNELCEQIKNYP